MQCGYVALHLGLVQLKVLEVGEALQCGYVALHLGLVQVKIMEVGEALESDMGGFAVRLCCRKKPHQPPAPSRPKVLKVLEVGEAFCSTAMSPFTSVWER